MNRRQQDQFEDSMQLKRNGWESQKKDFVAFNGGTDSETVEHWTGKCMAAYALRELGYRVRSEVSKPNVGEIDIVGLGHDSRPMIAIEIETDLSRDVILDKADRYCKGEPIMDVHAYDPADLPSSSKGIVEHIRRDLSYE